MMKIRADLKGIQLLFDEEKQEHYNASPPGISSVAKEKLPDYVIGDM
jgi:hypothetical protein